MDETASIAQPYGDVYEGFYRELNPGGAPTVGAVDAANYLKRSNLPMPLLGKIWEVADYQKKGVLDKRGVFMAFKLVAAAQQGLPLGPQLIYQAGLSPPQFGAGFSPAPSAMTGSVPLPPSGPSSGQASPVRAPTQNYQHPQWAIGQQDQQKYNSIFESLQPVDNKLPGDKVRPVLLNSGLPPGNLAKIWELSDQDKDGQLDKIEMNIALHLVYRALQGDAIPNHLPPTLIHPNKAHLYRRTSTTFNAQYPGSLPNQNSLRSRTSSVASLDGIGMPGQHPVAAQAQDRSFSVQPPHRGSTAATPVSGEAVGLMGDWIVDRVSCASQFAACDTNNDGLVSGADIRGFLIATGLPQQTLAHVWELADVNKTGMLNQEQFTLIIHLVGMLRNGEELPRTLPPHLLPPSLRQLSLQENGVSDSQASYRLPQSLPPLDLAEAVKSENPDIRQVAEEMEKLLLDRKNMLCDNRSILERHRSHEEEVDDQIVQLEADMTVKNSAIRNLQIELQSLEGTVKQLERQKTEATKRLGELDRQITIADQQGLAQTVKIAETRERMEVLQSDAEQSETNRQRDEEEMAALRQEVEQLETTLRETQGQLVNHSTNIETAVDEATKAERESVRDARQQKELLQEIENVKAVSTKLENILSDFSSGMNSGDDVESSLKKNLPLLEAVQNTKLLEDAVYGVASTSNQSFTNPAQNIPHPFTAAQTAPFGGFGSDPFGGNQNSAASQQPVGAAPVSNGIKAAPPRPAPPKSSRQTPVTEDPFANVDPFGQSAGASGGGFADFANFGAFN